MEVLKLETVLAYAKPLIHKFINEKAGDVPREHKDEIEQTGYLRIIEAFPRIQADAGWKSFVYTHCLGAVQDYMKFGKGFQESKWSLNSQPDEARTPKLTKRVEIYDDGQATDDFDIDRALGANGIFSEIDLDAIVIRWDLLARLSRNDDHLHAFARFLLGQSIEEMAPVFGVVRTRVSQMIQIFLDRFDDPEQADDPYFKQVCFALGICKQLGMPDVDQASVMGFAMGWKLDPVDLDWIPDGVQDTQMDMFGEQNEEESEQEEGCDF
jgi:hypothetical protein